MEVDGREYTFTVGAVEDVVDLQLPNLTGKKFSISADGERVLAAISSQDVQSPFVDLVVGWTDGIEEEE